MCCREYLRVLLCCVLVAGSAALAEAAVKLPAVIGDNMVLQRGQPAPIWGWADKGEEVTVAVAGQTLTAKAGDDGRWKVALEETRCGAAAGNDRQRLVWLCRHREKHSRR